MVALKLQNFGNMIPAMDPRLLPQTSAELSQNAWVQSGSIEGFRRLVPIYTPTTSAVKKVFRIPIQYYDRAHIPDSYWLEFDTQDVDVIQAPTDNDQFDRFYWASDADQPRYNTKARIASNLPALKLGIPAPTVAPFVSRAAGQYYLEAAKGTYTVRGNEADLYYSKAYGVDTQSERKMTEVDDQYEPLFGSTKAISVSPCLSGINGSPEADVSLFNPA